MSRPGDDRDLFLRALALAARGGRSTAPNPRVGAVLARDGRVVAEDWHRRAGEPHAEALALDRAGPAARGATLYVTLEPCSHEGRTPACARRIVEAGVARVVVGLVDPDPRVRGTGIRILEDAGIEVRLVEEDLRSRAEELLEDYLVHRREGRAFLVHKVAATLDGRIADRRGGSRWITGEAARAAGRALRDRCGAIVVGAGTVVADDPVLLPPTRGEEPPFLRVVLDGRLRVPATARLFREGPESPVLVCTTREGLASGDPGPLAAAGAEIVVLPAAPADPLAVDPGALLRELGRRGVLCALLEGGGRTAAPFHASGLVDRVEWFLAPALLADPGAVPAIAGGERSLADRLRFRIAEVERVGDDIHVVARPARS